MAEDRDSGYYTGGRGGYYVYPTDSYSTMPARGARGANVYRIVVPQNQVGQNPQVIQLGGGGAGGASQPQVIRVAPRSTDASGSGPQVIRLSGGPVGQGVRIVPGDSGQRVRIVQDSGSGSSIQYIPGSQPQGMRIVQGELPQGVRIIQTGGGRQYVEEPARGSFVRETPQGIRIISSGEGSSSPQPGQAAPGVRVYPEVRSVSQVEPEAGQGSGRFRIVEMPQGFRMVSSTTPQHGQSTPIRVVRMDSSPGPQTPRYSTYSTLPTRSSQTPSLSRTTSNYSDSGASTSFSDPGSGRFSLSGSEHGSLGRGNVQKTVSFIPGDTGERITLSPSTTGGFSFSVDSENPEGVQMAEVVDGSGGKVFLIKMAPKNRQTQFQEAYDSRQNRRKLQEFDDLVANQFNRYSEKNERVADRSSGSPQRGEGRGSPVTVTVHTPGVGDRDSPLRFHIRSRSQDGDATPPRRASNDSPKVNFEGVQGRQSPTQAPQRTMLRTATLDTPSSAESTPKNMFNKCKFKFGSIGNFNRSNSKESSSSDSEGSGNAIFFEDFDDMLGRIRRAREKHPDGCMCQGHTSPKHGGPSTRPKSFLREEVDEFDRIFSELLLSSREKFEDIKCTDPAEIMMGDASKDGGSDRSQQTEECDGQRTPTFRSPRSSSSHSPDGSCDTTNTGAGETAAGPGAGATSSQRDSGLFESSPLQSKFSKLFEDNEKLFSQLLDDLDNISSSNTRSLHRRRKARDLFSDWLFSEDALSPEQPMRERCREALKDLNRRRVQSAREAYDLRPREVFTRWRPKSFEYHSEDDADSGYHTGNSTLQGSRGKPPPGERTLTREDLRRRIESFNNNQHGLIMSLQQESETFQGFIRVHMNLIRPINMSISTRPPSIYDVLTHQEGSDAEDTMEDTHITSFYLPKDTTKVIHIDSATTAQEVIKALLAKFKITDNPRKFALYTKITREGVDKRGGMQRLSDEERPLPLCLSWTDEGLGGLDVNRFVLQENDTGEIMWEAFSVPELENFLKILGREEEEYVDQVKNKYRLLRIQMSKRLQELEKDKQKGAAEDKFPPSDKREPVFV